MSATNTRRIVASAERLQAAEGNSLIVTRTSVFPETATLKEVFDWLRYNNDGTKHITMGTSWWNATLSLTEDEMTKERHPLDRHEGGSEELLNL